MSEAVTALSGANFDGTVNIHEAGLRGMITVRGNLGAENFKAAIQKLTGMEVPETGSFTSKGSDKVIWMSPDELLIMTAYETVSDLVQKIGKSLKDHHHLVVNVSDMRAVFLLKGAYIREVLAKLSSADLSSDTFLPGQVRRTRLAQVAVAFWMADAETVELVCFRSVSGYTFKLLKRAAG